MDAVKVSPKYQIVIPESIRSRLGIRPGQRLQVFELEGRIELVPELPVTSLRGRFPGISTRVERDDDRA